MTARRIQEATSADIGLVFPEEGQLEAYVIDDLDGSRIRSIIEARNQDDPAQAVRTFADEITSEPVSEQPAIVGQMISLAIVLALVLGAAFALEQFINRQRRAKATQADQPSRSAEASTTVDA